MFEKAVLGVLKEHEAHGPELKKPMAELLPGGVSSGSLSSAHRLELVDAVRTIDHARLRLSAR